MGEVRKVLDLEMLPNFFGAVVIDLDSKKSTKYVVHESQNDMPAFMDMLGQRPTFIGFNVIEFDGQVLEYIWQNAGKVTAEQIYEFTQKLINRSMMDKFDLPYSEWNMSFRYIDVYKICHYDNKKTSLKWLQFSMRWPNLQDMPVAHDQRITKSNIPAVMSYCSNDTLSTREAYFRSKAMIELREELRSKFKEPRIMNMSDSSLGAFIFEHRLVNDYGFNKKKLKQGSWYDEIKVKDCLLPYIKFKHPEFQRVHQVFKDLVLTDVKTKGIKDEAYSQTAFFEDMVFVYGTGGIHACYRAGEFTPDDDTMICSVDVSSFYPNLPIANDFYPKHIGQEFCKIYKDVYDERQTHPKGSPLNYAYKIALNSVYGKSNSAYSIFFDPAYTLKTTINGQLLMTMLAESLAPLGRILMVNTDGLEIMIPRSKYDELRDICEIWEMSTKLDLEFTSYKKIVIKDVNNYIAIDEKGKAKRKGYFETYYDITEEDGKPHFYNKNPSATIIPEALYAYYAEGTPIEDSINGCNDIYPFLYGVKKQKGFEHWFITAHPDGVVDIERSDDKVIRYYICKNGANIFKFWKDNRKNNLVGINRGLLVKLAMNIRNPEIERLTKGTKLKESQLIIQFDVDKEHYIKECYKMIDLISSGTRDTAYITYNKKQAKLNLITETEEE